MAASKAFKIGDLVWAKLKGYPHWPARVMNAYQLFDCKNLLRYLILNEYVLYVFREGMNKIQRRSGKRRG